jgi:hypothetical protein
LKKRYFPTTNRLKIEKGFVRLVTALASFKNILIQICLLNVYLTITKYDENNDESNSGCPFIDHCPIG